MRAAALTILLCCGLGCSNDGGGTDSTSTDCPSDEFCQANAEADQREGHGLWLVEENVLCRELDNGTKRCSECLDHEDCPPDYRCSGQQSCVEGERNRSRCSTDEQCTTFAESPTFRDEFHDTDAVVCAELDDGFMNCSECPPGVECPQGLSCVDGMFCQ